MTRIISAFALSLCIAAVALAQTEDSKMNAALENGKNLPVRLNVGGNVTASAVLIPRVDARRIFGKEIADNYAVVEVNIGNKSPDASLIIHSVYIDYSRWALSGTTGELAGAVDDSLRDPVRTLTSTSQVASAEYRVVRGQLLDAQMWSKRNWTMRLLTFAGNLAGAYAFSINEQGIVKGLNAFSGVFVPGLRDVWPDGTIEQLNRVSDFGFRANQVIPRQGSEVIVCFFPIDRFLTPGFKKLFLKSPALFFAPGMLLQDNTVSKDIERVLGDDLGIRAETIGALNIKGGVLQRLRDKMPCYTSIIEDAYPGSRNGTLLSQMRQAKVDVCLGQFGLVREVRNGKPTGALKLRDNDSQAGVNFASFAALDYISQASLNTVRVAIDGTMAVDATVLAAKIDDLEFDDVPGCGDDKEPCFWGSPELTGGVRTGMITGSYLTGGSLTIAEANELGITEIKPIVEGSDDQHLKFSLKLTAPVSDKTLTFKVTKLKPGNNSSIDSPPHLYTTGATARVPKVTEVSQDGNKLTVTGLNFIDVATRPLSVVLQPPDGDALTLDSSKFTIKSDKKIELDIPTDATAPGCWQLMVYMNKTVAQKPEENSFVVLPTMTSARLEGEEIIVEGTGLDASDCEGVGVDFKLLDPSGKPFKLELQENSTDTKARFKLPAGANGVDANWKVQMLFAGKSSTTHL